MTNEQLKILLENQAALLRIAIEKAVELMPEGAEKEMEWVYIGDEKGLALASTFMACAGKGYEDNPDFERQPKGNHLALIPLYDHLDEIERQIIELGAVYLTTGADICKAREKWDSL